MTQQKNSSRLVRYGRALVEILVDLGPGEIATRIGIGAVAIGAAVWFQHFQDPFWGAVALGAVLLGVCNSVLELLDDAWVRTSRLWYAPGRVVHHLTLGRCRVLDYDDRPEVAPETWLLLQPLERGEEAPAVWTELVDKIASSNTELLERWDRGQI